MAPQPATLYGVSHSMYTGRVRSYLIKSDIPYREQAPNTQHYFKAVLPQAGGRFSMPTLELADSSVIRDGAAIVEHFEEATGHTFSPETAKQRVVSRLFDVIGAEGLLRPAMHYRWNFDAENLELIKVHMNMITPPGSGGLEMAGKIAEQMRKSTVRFGANSETRDVVEALYAEQLAALDSHFAIHPYLIGGRPCIGDFSLLSPLFGHLGRDPKPLSLMLARGLNVFRWLERMNRRDADLDIWGQSKNSGARSQRENSATPTVSTLTPNILLSPRVGFYSSKSRSHPLPSSSLSTLDFASAGSAP